MSITFKRFLVKDTKMYIFIKQSTIHFFFFNLKQALAAPQVSNLNFLKPDYFSTETKMMMVNFYADWCRFSRMLEPVFKDAAAKAAEEFGDVDVKFARADCDKERKLQKFLFNFINES